MASTQTTPIRLLALTTGSTMALVASLTGCALLRSTPTPIPSFTYETGQPRSDTLAVLLPGRGGHPDDFTRAGFPAMMTAAGFDGEVIGVDAHLAYYVQRTVIDRVYEDVVTPRQEKTLWIVGVSLGGLGGLLYERTHPGDIAGLILLAPYLGDDDVIAEIRAAGGLPAWEPRDLKPDDFQRELWLWIKRGGLNDVPIFLGWGEDDDFAVANALLAEVVPQARTFTVPGGHNWDVWKRVFAGLIREGAFSAVTRKTTEIPPP